MLTDSNRVSAWGPLVLVVIAAVATLLWVSPADAGKKKREKKVQRIERTAEADYLAATGLRGTQDSPCLAETVGCVIFQIEKGERFVAIEVNDAAGEPVWVSVYVNGYSDGTDPHEHACGSSDTPFNLREGLTELVVVITQTTAGATSPCPGAATSGTVSATLSNIP